MNRHFLKAFSIAAVSLLSACERTMSTPQGRAEPADNPALAVSLKMTDNEEFVVRFVNQSDKPIRILKPLDGSYYSWIMPHYAFSLDDGKESKVDQFPRCGNFGNPYADTTWPDDYLVEIGPGKSHEESTYLLFVLPEDGEYTVTFEYVFTPDSDLLPTGQHAYPRKLWKGRAASNPLRVRLRARHPVVG